MQDRSRILQNIHENGVFLIDLADPGGYAHVAFCTFDFELVSGVDRDAGQCTCRLFCFRIDLVKLLSLCKNLAKEHLHEAIRELVTQAATLQNAVGTARQENLPVANTVIKSPASLVTIPGSSLLSISHNAVKL